ncbi:MAG: hypothetical protein IKS31_00325 [Clostridia bacterium]|nr:hypothetical protein [Clostridia bacterium]MBR4457393.1 hypothetical protein [Clostridia bacterium]
MKCPSCGQWNRSTNPRCFRCGAFLTPEGDPEHAWKDKIRDRDHGAAYYRMDDSGESDATEDSRDRLAAEMSELKDRKAEGAVHLRKMRTGATRRGEENPGGMKIRVTGSADAFWRTDGNAARMVRPGKPQRGSRTVVEDTGAAAMDWSQPAEPDPLWLEQADYHERWSQLPKGQNYVLRTPRQRFLSRLGKFWLILVIVLGTGVLGYAGYGFLQRSCGNRAEPPQALITASMMDDLAAHTIQIPGEDGQEIFIRELTSTYVVQDGYATIQVQDHIFYDSEENLTDPTMDITLTPYLKSASGRQEPLTPITYTIDIPLSPIELITPESLYTTVSSTMYTMKFTVRPGSVVKMNGVDISDTINYRNGEISYNAMIQPKGDNVYTLTCRSQYCRENRLDIVLYREPQEIPLDLAADTYTSTSLAHMLVKCSTMPGARVTILSPHSDLDITNLNTTGAFTFYANFSRIGDNMIQIEASYPGKKTSRIDYKIYYLPSIDVYTRKAWPMNADTYSELVSNIQVRSNRQDIYVITGMLQYFVSEKPQLAVFNTSEDGKGQPVLVENTTNKSWQVGEYYRIFADAYSLYDNMPWLCGRFADKN